MRFLNAGRQGEEVALRSPGAAAAVLRATTPYPPSGAPRPRKPRGRGRQRKQSRR